MLIDRRAASRWPLGRHANRAPEKFLAQEFVSADGQRQQYEIHTAVVQVVQQNRCDLFGDAHGNIRPALIGIGAAVAR